MPVRHIHSHEEYKQQIQGAGDKLVVVDFFATWCGPCKKISPYMETLSTQYENVIFLKVDVDELETVSKEEEISAMPTFYFYKAGKRVADLVGASQEGLLNLVKKHAV